MEAELPLLRRYSEDFGGREKVLFWLLGVLPSDKRADLQRLLEERHEHLGLTKQRSPVALHQVAREGGAGANVAKIDYEGYKWEFRYFV